MTQRKMKDSTFRISVSIDRALARLCRDGFSGDADRMFSDLLEAYEERTRQFVAKSIEQAWDEFDRSLRES